MTLLKRLIKSKKAQPQSLETQIEALTNKPEAELRTLVQSNAQEALREAALARLEYSPVLLQVALEDASGRLQLAARKRLGGLLESDQLDPAQLSRDLPNQEQLLTLSSYSARAGQQLLEQITDPSLLLKLAIEGASIQIRQTAAEKLETRPELEQLVKAAQGRDKTVYKLAKARLEVFKAEDAHQAEVEAQAKVICEKLEQLARVEADPLYQAKLDKLQRDCEALDRQLPAALAERYQTALSNCRKPLEAKAELLAQVEVEHQNRQAAEQGLSDALQQTKQLIEALFVADTEQLESEQFPEHLQRMRAIQSETPANAGSGKVQQLEQALHASEELFALLREHGSLNEVATALAETPDPQASQALKKILRQMLKVSQWLDGPLPQAVQQARELLAERETKEKDLERAHRKQISELEDLARRGQSAAAGGLVRKARGIHHASLEKRVALEKLPAGVSAQLEKFDQAMERLSDWHEFAVTPKKEALIEKMRSLADTSLAPEGLARQIHELQDDWKLLSKGVPHADEDLWKQFQAASDIAFEPCKEFFDAQAREREQNQAHREQLIEQLSQYMEQYHWDQPVWRDVEQTLKTARREWRDAWPVPRQAIKDQEARFEPLMEQLHSRLEEAYGNHKVAKEALVEQARTLAQQDDLQQAVEGAKQLQARWKDIGKCRPREDNALWKEFRAQCDAIFERRQEIYQAADAEREAQQQQAEQIIAQLNSLAALPTAELRAAQDQVAELKNQFEQLAQLPRAHASTLKDKYSQALRSIDENLKQARVQAKERQWQALFNAADALRRAEVAALKNNEPERALAEAQAAIEQVEQWPGNSRQILEQRLKEAAQTSTEQKAASVQALNELLIRADILAGKESPEQERPARMAYQMSLLQKGLGQQHQDTPESLLMDWLALRGLDETEYQAGLERLKPVLPRA